MNKINQVIVLATSLIFLSTSISYAQYPIEKNAEPSSSSKQTISINKETILKTAYPNTLHQAMVYVEPKELDDYFKKLPREQLEENVLGFFHPIIAYKNPQGEDRYLIIVEKVNIYDGYIQDCRACSSTGDFLIYKKQENQFILINSAKDQTQVPSGNGHFSLDFQKDIQKNLQSFGKNIMGSFTKALFTGAGGQENSIWYALLLPDVGKIQALEIGSAGGSLESYYADRPELASSTSSTLKIIANHSEYYPIEVTYIDKGKEKKPYKSTFTYSAQKAEYVEKTSK